MNWRKTTRIVLGTVLILLGLLWTLQGADLLRIPPVACVADCEPITGGSVEWLVIGVVAMLVGIGVVGALWRRIGRR